MPRSRGLAWWAWLVVAFLAAQAVGGWHSTRHAQGLAHAIVPTAVADDAHARDQNHDHDAGDADCRLLDQLLHADALGVPDATRPWPTLAHVATVEGPQRSWQAVPGRARARGPPAA